MQEILRVMGIPVHILESKTVYGRIQVFDQLEDTTKEAHTASIFKSLFLPYIWT